MRLIDFNLISHIHRFLSVRPRSENEVEEYIKKRIKKGNINISCDIETFVRIHIDHLKEYDYIGDYKYAVWYVKNRLDYSPRGAILLRQELSKKGISMDVIESVLKELYIDPQKYISDLIRKKKRVLKNYSEKVLNKRFMDYLLRKGFTFTEIKSYFSSQDS